MAFLGELQILSEDHFEDMYRNFGSRRRLDGFGTIFLDVC
jgi:hypothetical protein